MTLRHVAEEIAEGIREDEYLRESGKMAVIVEDNADIRTEIELGLAESGLQIVVAVTGFDRRGDSGAVLTGTVAIEIRILENPSLNRSESEGLTAQNAAEHLATCLHWSLWETVNGPLRFSGMNRDDVDGINVMRMNFAGECSLRG